MNEQLEQILEQPNKVKLGILAGTVALILGAYWYFFYSPLGEELTEVQGKIDKVKLEVAEKQGIAANLPRFELEVERLDAELRKAFQELPDKREVARLLSRISDKARDSGLEIKLFRPKGEEKRDFYAKVPVEVAVVGTYHEVGAFFDEVAHLERIVNISDLTMVEPVIKEEEILLKTSVIATSFRFLDEGERPKDEKKGKKRRKKRKKR